ncbi:putative ubiquitin-conjugating enzyme E2 7 [Tritrichomonas foetus]|uniref:Ubiquitin-conjugating enzyme E2 7 n=1 Tax=Tritrichomonas foetus TaxID=1144522 RepID=A0A1J4L114_9EUKA|nr:putative ubiquitin-conjugating enzyme E2 7 [Tritrichomonas foetus]|eukprot:OHT16776.1 putative ubiquitin-conjugating enzyme E2 7 [Tritrichomonas foetus]
MMNLQNYAHQTILKQFLAIQTDPNSGINASFIDNNIYRWRVTLFGPPNSPYSGGVFPALIEFPDDYPSSPPKMKFLCPMYHPNVTDNGDVCISLLDNKLYSFPEYQRPSNNWIPDGHSAQSILIEVQAMLSEPDFESPANPDVAYTYYTNPREFMRKVKRSLLSDYTQHQF